MRPSNFSPLEPDGTDQHFLETFVSVEVEVFGSAWVGYYYPARAGYEPAEGLAVVEKPVVAEKGVVGGNSAAEAVPVLVQLVVWRED